MSSRGVSRFFMRAATKMSRSSAGKKVLDVASRSVTIQRVTLGSQPDPGCGRRTQPSERFSPKSGR